MSEQRNGAGAYRLLVGYFYGVTLFVVAVLVLLGFGPVEVSAQTVVPGTIVVPTVVNEDGTPIATTPKPTAKVPTVVPSPTPGFDFHKQKFIDPQPKPPAPQSKLDGVSAAPVDVFAFKYPYGYGCQTPAQCGTVENLTPLFAFDGLEDFYSAFAINFENSAVNPEPWIDIDVGELVYIEEFRVYQGNIENYMQRLRVEASIDGSTYSDITGGQAASLGWTIFAPSSAGAFRYYRLYGWVPGVAGSKYWWVNSWEAYAVATGPCGTEENPCVVSGAVNSTQIFPTLDEARAGAMIGCMILYGILWMFLRSDARLVVGAGLLVSQVLSIFTGLYVYLYAWVLFIVCVVALDKLRGLFVRSDDWGRV